MKLVKYKCYTLFTILLNVYSSISVDYSKAIYLLSAHYILWFTTGLINIEILELISIMNKLLSIDITLIT